MRKPRPTTAAGKALFLACAALSWAAQAQITPDGSLGTTVSRAGAAWTISGGTQRGGNLFHSLAEFGVPRNHSATFAGSAGNIVARVTGGAASVIDGRLASGASLWLVNPAGISFGSGASLAVQGSFHAASAHNVRLSNGDVFQASLGGGSTLSAAPPAAFGFVGPAAPVSVRGATLGVPTGRDLTLAAGGALNVDGARLFAQGGEAALSGDTVNVSGSTINVASLDAGGRIAIRGGDVSLAGSALFADAFFAPARGISLEAARTLTVGNSAVFSGSLRSADAGPVTMQAARVVLADGTIVNTDSFHGGRGGDISIRGGEVVISGAGTAVSVRSLRDGPAGDLLVQADGRFTLDQALMGTDAGGTGAAGNITVSAGEIVIREEGQIRSNTDGTGRGGRVELRAAGSILVERTGLISIDTYGPGRGGEVVISAGESFGLYGEIRSGAQRGRTGDAGSVSVGAREVVIGEGGSISTLTIGRGRAGDIRISAESVDISRASEDLPSVEARTSGPGRGGSIFISAGRVVLRDGGQVSASSDGRGLAGAISIDARESVVLSGGSAITTEALFRDGGDVTIRAGELLHLKDSHITTSVNRDTGSGGNISIDPTFVVLDNSRILAQAKEGAGGNISIVTDFFIGDRDSVSASSERGFSGAVAISTPKADLSSGLVVLASNFLVAHRLSETCASRAGRGSSSFIAAGRGGLPASLDLPYRAAPGIRSLACPPRQG